MEHEVKIARVKCFHFVVSCSRLSYSDSLIIHQATTTTTTPICQSLIHRTILHCV